MRRSFVSAALICLAGAAVAQPAAQSAPAQPAAQPQAAPDAAVQIEQLQRQLALAGAEIRRLRAIEATSASTQAARDACVEKNKTLVAVGRDILAAYDKRYRRGRHDPLQLGRTRFETEAQDFAGQIYDNRYDVPPAKTPPAQPASGTTDTKNP